MTPHETPAGLGAGSVLETEILSAARRLPGVAIAAVEGEEARRELERSLSDWLREALPQGAWSIGLRGPEAPFRAVAAVRTPQFLRTLASWLGAKRLPVLLLSDAASGCFPSQKEAAALAALSELRLSVSPLHSSSFPFFGKTEFDQAEEEFWGGLEREASLSGSFWFERMPGGHAEAVAAGRIPAAFPWLKRKEAAELASALFGRPWAAASGAAAASRTVSRMVRSGELRATPGLWDEIERASSRLSELRNRIRGRYPALCRPVSFWILALEEGRGPVGSPEAAAGEIIREARKLSPKSPAQALLSPAFRPCAPPGA